MLLTHNSLCFKIIDKANSKFYLKIKEALHINWRKPNLEHVYMRTEVNSNRFEISNGFEKSFRLHGDFTAAMCK